jgi:hypothetical protein
MESQLLKILLYFDVFSYPLTREELLHLAGYPEKNAGQIEESLESMALKGWIKQEGGFYYIGPGDHFVKRRIDGNLLAQKRMKAAQRYSRIISWFPFVRGVFLSGSISKGFMAGNDDIDYFIVTEPGRLWLSRTLLTLFKKIFLLDSYRNFCINYFVDTQNLFIPDQNIFTATEIVFTLPTFNLSMHEEFLKTNSWTLRYYPTFRQNGSPLKDNAPLLKIFFEKLLQNSMGDRLEKFFLKKSGNYIRKKFTEMGDEEFSKAFSIKPHELRYLPNRQQFRILSAYEKRIKDFEKLTGLSLGPDLAQQIAEK